MVPNRGARSVEAGFAIPIWAIGADRGWHSRTRARELTTNLLRFLRDAPQGRAADATGHRGLYYHFLDLESGARVWQCELSTIDTALLLAGIRFARCYFDADIDAERELRDLADELTDRVDWDWLTLPAGARHAGSISHGWRPENGAIPWGWTGYNEALILHVLAAGSGYADAKTAYARWVQSYEWRKPWPDLELLAFPPLFGHQYSHLFVDFRAIPDAYMRERGIDYFENSQRAVEAQRRYAAANPAGFQGYGPDIWGLTACDGPGPDHGADRQFRGYTARGVAGPDHVQSDDGTIAPTAAAASIQFAPDAAIAAIAAMHDRFGPAGLWGRYGFQDAFNPTADWIAPDCLAIDQGPIVLAIENWRSEFVWRHMMADPVLRRGLDVLGFTAPPTPRFEAAIAAFERADRAATPPTDPVLFVGSSSIVRWADLEADMAGLPAPVLNRGFGGSRAIDVIRFFDRVITPYRPRAIVLYEGDNDVATGSSPLEVLVRIREIARRLQRDLPGTPLLVLALKPSVARAELWPVMQRANALLRDHCDRTAGCEFVDITTGMLTSTGAIRDDIFVTDRLHMNRRGYDAWAAVVAPALQAVLSR